MAEDPKTGRSRIVATPADARPASAPWRTPAARGVDARTGPFRIALAEDDDELRSVVADSLRSDGYDVVELSDGGRFLEIATRIEGGDEGAPVDLIVSDIRMPVCSGLEILSALRNADCRIPVILMTAFGDEDTRRRAEGLSAVLFDKPFDVDDLRTAVTNLLHGVRR